MQLARIALEQMTFRLPYPPSGVLHAILDGAPITLRPVAPRSIGNELLFGVWRWVFGCAGSGDYEPTPSPFATRQRGKRRVAYW